jgi:L-fucose mutarotase
MLKGIPSILSPDLLHALRAMGHGDEIAIVDANYPADSAGPIVVRLDGHTATDVIDAVLALMPLDTFVEEPAVTMQVVGSANKREPIMDEFAALIEKHDPGTKMGSMERFAFYDRVRSAYAVVQTGESRLYGNIILKMGVIGPKSS